jgi:hypothetical protein
MHEYFYGKVPTTTEKRGPHISVVVRCGSTIAVIYRLYSKNKFHL